MDAAAADIPLTPTPILDRTAPLPPLARHDPQQLQQVLGIVLGFAVALVIVLLEFGERLGPWITAKLTHISFWPRGNGQLVLLVFDLAVGFFLAVAIHEAAHLLVGVWVGFSFNSVRVGPLQIDRPFRISLYRVKSTMAV